MSKRELDLVNIILMDEDENVPVDKAIIAKFDQVTIKKGESPQTTMLNLAVNQNLKEVIEKHNDIRKGLVNLKTLERRGIEVKLQPITIEDVSVKMQ